MASLLGAFYCSREALIEIEPLLIETMNFFLLLSFLVRPFKARNCLKLLEGEKEERTNERKKERRPQAMRMNEDWGKFA